MLAYVFWHSPGSADTISTYEAALAAFHSSLDPADIRGFRGSQACLVQGASWFSAPVVYEDFYLVDDFTALGALNEAAVAGHRRRPHDNVAGMTAEGMAGVELWVGLGPTPEFCSIDDDEVPTGAVVVTRVRTVAASAA